MSGHGDLQPFQRLDQMMVERGLAPSRSRAADAITRGSVFVDGEMALKAAQKIAPQATITLDDPAEGYVSRAALKLLAALDAFDFSPEGLRALDVGASTGGFTQVLLERGAVHVTAVDVGHDQLHARLRSDPRVLNREGLNARALSADDVPGPVEAIVSDVSFISLRLALPASLALAEAGAWAVLLVKPQFEVGRKAVGKGGIVRDREEAARTAEAIAAFVGSQPGWRVTGLIECPVAGSDGNREYLLGARRDA